MDPNILLRAFCEILFQWTRLVYFKTYRPEQTSLHTCLTNLMPVFVCVCVCVLCVCMCVFIRYNHPPIHVWLWAYSICVLGAHLGFVLSFHWDWNPVCMLQWHDTHTHTAGKSISRSGGIIRALWLILCGLPSLASPNQLNNDLKPLLSPEQEQWPPVWTLPFAQKVHNTYRTHCSIPRMWADLWISLPC